MTRSEKARKLSKGQKSTPPSKSSNHARNNNRNISSGETSNPISPSRESDQNLKSPDRCDQLDDEQSSPSTPPTISSCNPRLNTENDDDRSPITGPGSENPAFLASESDAVVANGEEEPQMNRLISVNPLSAKECPVGGNTQVPTYPGKDVPISTSPSAAPTFHGQDQVRQTTPEGSKKSFQSMAMGPSQKLPEPQNQSGSATVRSAQSAKARKSRNKSLRSQYWDPRLADGAFKRSGPSRCGQNTPSLRNVPHLFPESGSSQRRNVSPSARTIGDKPTAVVYIPPGGRSRTASNRRRDLCCLISSPSVAGEKISTPTERTVMEPARCSIPRGDWRTDAAAENGPTLEFLSRAMEDLNRISNITELHKMDDEEVCSIVSRATGLIELCKAEAQLFSDIAANIFNCIESCEKGCKMDDTLSHCRRCTRTFRLAKLMTESGEVSAKEGDVLQQTLDVVRSDRPELVHEVDDWGS